MRSCAPLASPTMARSCIVAHASGGKRWKEQWPSMNSLLAVQDAGRVSSLVFDAYIFALACFLGFIVISKVPSILHTPLMSATNAIHGIVYVGAVYLAATSHGWLGDTLAACAVALGAVNVVGGFVVT